MQLEKLHKTDTKFIIMNNLKNFYTGKTGCPGDVEVKVLGCINDHVQISILLKRYTA